MRKFAIPSLLLLCCCSHLINKPKNLVPKDTMAEVLAELAINDQLPYVGQNVNMEAETKYVFQKHHLKGADFSDSYKYYLADGDLQKIYGAAQEIIKNKDLKAAAYIEKKLKEENKNFPPGVHQ